MLRVCDIIAFAPMLGDLNRHETSISEENFLCIAKWWRRSKACTIANSDSDDARTKQLIARVNALPAWEPDLTLDEIVALLSLVYPHRCVIPNAWSEFCAHLKNGKVPFNEALPIVMTWGNHVVPIGPSHETTALNRLFEQIFVIPPLARFYADCTQQPLKEWSSVGEFNKAFVDFFLRFHVYEITSAGLKIDSNPVVPFPENWTPNLTAQLTRIKERADKKIYSY